MSRAAQPAAPQLLDIETAALAAHPRNVRRSVGDVTELAASITERGVLEPLVVAPAGDGTYIVIAGHRRLAAAQQACVLEVPCIVRHDITEDVDVVTAMLVENLMRSDLSAVEEAEAYQQLEMAGVKPAQIAQRTGRSKATVTSRLALMRLPEATRDKVHGHQLNLEEAAALIEFADDPTTVAHLEAVAGTHNWRWELEKAKTVRVNARKTEQARAALAATGVKVVGIRDLKRGSWMHNLSRFLDDDTIPAITETSDPEDDDEARRAAHADCPHHAAYILNGNVTYVCLDPDVHTAPTDDGDEGDDETATDGTSEAVARDLAAEREARAAQIAQDQADLQTATGIRRTFVTDLAAGRAGLISDTRVAAIGVAFAQHAVEFYVEITPQDVAPYLGVAVPEQPTSGGYVDEEAWSNNLTRTVQDAMAKRGHAAALLHRPRPRPEGRRGRRGSRRRRRGPHRYHQRRHRVTPDTAARVQRLIRWVTELTSYEHHYSPGHRSTVLDHELLDDTRALAAAASSVLGTGPGPVQVEADIRAVLGLIGNDPEAYRDDDTSPADRDLTGG